jgi:hypothetical protein
VTKRSGIERHMTVMVKFKQSGQFNAGTFKFLDLDKISHLQLNHLRNTYELLATTPENPQPNTPYIIATREHQYEIEAILKELQQLKKEKKNLIYEITETEVHLIST